MVCNSPKFSPPMFINARVFNKLPTDSPNFSSPKTLEPLIRQNFPPPKFSHVRYTTDTSFYHYSLLYYTHVGSRNSCIFNLHGLGCSSWDNEVNGDKGYIPVHSYHRSYPGHAP